MIDSYELGKYFDDGVLYLFLHAILIILTVFPVITILHSFSVLKQHKVLINVLLAIALLSLSFSVFLYFGIMPRWIVGLYVVLALVTYFATAFTVVLYPKIRRSRERLLGQPPDEQSKPLKKQQALSKDNWITIACALVTVLTAIFVAVWQKHC